MSNITLKIDNIIEEVIDTLPSSIYKILDKTMGGVENLYKLEATSSKLKESNFKILSDKLESVNKDLLNLILRRVIEYVRELMKEYDVDLAMDKFLAQIQATINLNMQGIPETIRSKVIQTVLDSYEDDNIQELAEKLKTSIGGSIKQSMNVISEALTRKVREQNFSIMLKAEEEGDMWLFSHPIDSKNDPFCRKYGNAIKSREEWIKLKPNFFTQGGHFGCRGIPILVKKKDISEVNGEVAFLVKKADKLDREGK